MRVHWITLALATVAPCIAAAQTTADGVQAFAEGDYETAVRILRPLAEEVPEPDPLAQFVMAALYDQGSGVPANDVRACGLYLKAATSAHPVATQALALAAQIHQEHPGMRALCAEAAAGAWGVPRPEVFTLGPDHWVRSDQSELTVGYQGTETETVTGFGGVDWVFLPTRYTRLDVSRPVPAPRHFIEFFVWMPYKASDPPLWTLVWFAREVDGPHVRPVPGDLRVMTVSGARPPELPSIDRIAQWRVNADGEAERVVRGAKDPIGPAPGAR
jgi:hypothetical protein